MDVTPIILSGGSGTRLWPLSRTLYPKQFLPLIEAQTMLQATVARVDPKLGFRPPVVVAGEDHRFLVADQLDAAGVTGTPIILEPVERNTANAIALAAHFVSQGDASALMLVMPSDHVVRDVASFHAAIVRAMPAARAGALVAFGVHPDRPETGYGYIRSGGTLADVDGAFVIANFTEKPDRAQAQAFLEAGGHFWNSGIFMFSAQAYLDALTCHAPAIAEACRIAMAGAVRDGRFVRPVADYFSASPSGSIDYAVMEKAENAVVVSVEMGWTDLGSWEGLWALSQHDAAGNAVEGDVIAIESHNNLLRVDRGPMVTLLGVDDLVVVSTRDAVLVASKEKAQDVGLIVDALKARGSDLHHIHSVVHRPWGTYESTSMGDRYQTKKIIVKPGGQLSLQMHHHRSEHWIVVSGTARVTVGDQVVLLQENQSTYIPVGTTHRLENPGKVPLQLIEVQCGGYLGEDDIVRFEDNYGRVG